MSHDHDCWWPMLLCALAILRCCFIASSGMRSTFDSTSSLFCMQFSLASINETIVSNVQFSEGLETHVDCRAFNV